MRSNQASFNIKRFGKYVPENCPADIQQRKQMNNRPTLVNNRLILVDATL